MTKEIPNKFCRIIEHGYTQILLQISPIPKERKVLISSVCFGIIMMGSISPGDPDIPLDKFLDGLDEDEIINLLESLKEHFNGTPTRARGFIGGTFEED